MKIYANMKYQQIVNIKFGKEHPNVAVPKPSPFVREFAQRKALPGDPVEVTCALARLHKPLGPQD